MTDDSDTEHLDPFRYYYEAEGTAESREAALTWIGYAKNILRGLPVGWIGTAEDILHYLAGFEQPPTPNTWGALMNALVRDKILAPTGSRHPLRSQHSHGRMGSVYCRLAD